jgi:hypothetical protein
LELGSRGSQDAATSIGISEAAVSIQAVAAGWVVAANTVLTIVELTEYT